MRCISISTSRAISNKNVPSRFRLQFDSFTQSKVSFGHSDPYHLDIMHFWHATSNSNPRKLPIPVKFRFKNLKISGFYAFNKKAVDGCYGYHMLIGDMYFLWSQQLTVSSKGVTVTLVWHSVTDTVGLICHRDSYLVTVNVRFVSKTLLEHHPWAMATWRHW